MNYLVKSREVHFRFLTTRNAPDRVSYQLHEADAVFGAKVLLDLPDLILGGAGVFREDGLRPIKPVIIAPDDIAWVTRRRFAQRG